MAKGPADIRASHISRKTILYWSSGIDPSMKIEGYNIKEGKIMK
jgi:hypothetical protein